MGEATSLEGHFHFACVYIPLVSTLFYFQRKKREKIYHVDRQPQPPHTANLHLPLGLRKEQLWEEEMAPFGRGVDVGTVPGLRLARRWVCAGGKTPPVGSWLLSDPGPFPGLTQPSLIALPSPPPVLILFQGPVPISTPSAAFPYQPKRSVLV